MEAKLGLLPLALMFFFNNKIMFLDQRIPVHSVCNVYTVNILKLLYAAETEHVCLYILLGKVRTLLERYCDSLNESKKEKSFSCSTVPYEMTNYR